MANIMTSTQNNLNNPLLLRKAVEEGLKYEGDTFAAKYYKKEIIKQRALVDTSVSTSHYLLPLTEDEVPGTVAITEGFQSSIPWQVYGISRQITKIASLLKGGDQLMDMVTDSAEDILRTRDAVALRPFRQAFDSTVTLADGVSFINTSHPLRNASIASQSNTFSDGIQRALSYESLLDLANVMDNQVDHSGNPIVSSSKKTLMVSLDQRNIERAFQLIGGNSNDMKPGTQNNDKNFFTRYSGVKYDMLVVNPMRLQTAIAMGETTDTLALNAAQWENRFFLLDEMRARKYLAMSCLKGHDNLTQSLTTESFGEKYITETSFGAGIRAGVTNWIVGSRGDGAAL